jgi:hypothetical protein
VLGAIIVVSTKALFPSLLASWIQLNPVAGTPWLVLKPNHLPFLDGLSQLKHTLEQCDTTTLYYAPVLMADIPKGVDTPIYLPQPRNGGIERLWYQNWLGTCLCVHEDVLLTLTETLKYHTPTCWQDAWHWVCLWLYHQVKGQAKALPSKHTHWIPYSEARTAWFTLPPEQTTLEPHIKRLNTFFQHVTNTNKQENIAFEASRQGGSLLITPRKLDTLPPVTIVLPFRDKPELLATCVETLLTYFEYYPNITLVGINNQSSHPETLALMQKLSAEHAFVKFVDYDAPFNYAAMHNAHIADYQGDYLLLLNNDIELLTPTWLLDMVTWHVRLSAWIPERPVGLVGIQLHYPPTSQGFVGIQHAGVTLGVKGEVGHSFKHHPVSKADTWGWLRGCREVMAVTGACMLIEKKCYESLGGFDANHFPIDFNDIDLCLKAYQAGYRNILLNQVQAIHHESISRGRKPTSREKKKQQQASRAYFKTHYHDMLHAGDPTYSPALTLLDESASPMPLPRMEGNFQQLMSFRFFRGVVKVFRHGYKPWLLWAYYLKR